MFMTFLTSEDMPHFTQHAVPHETFEAALIRFSKLCEEVRRNREFLRVPVLAGELTTEQAIEVENAAWNAYHPESPFYG